MKHSMEDSIEEKFLKQSLYDLLEESLKEFLSEATYEEHFWINLLIFFYRIHQVIPGWIVVKYTEKLQKKSGWVSERFLEVFWKIPDGMEERIMNKKVWRNFLVKLRKIFIMNSKNSLWKEDLLKKSLWRYIKGWSDFQEKNARRIFWKK